MKTMPRPPVSLATIFLLFFVSVIAPAQSEKSDALVSIQKKINTRLYTMLKLSEQWHGETPDVLQEDKIRIISQSAVLINDPANPVPLPDEILQNQEYEILDYQNRYYQIETTSGQRGWLSELYVERFAESAGANDLGISLPSGSKKAALLGMANETYASIIQLYESAEKLAKDTDDGNSEVFKAIQQKKRYSDLLYARDFEGFLVEEKVDSQIAQRVSVNGRLAFGTSSFNRSFASSADELQKTGNTDLGLQLAYKLNSNSALTLEGGTRKEALQSIYRNSYGGAGYRFSSDGRTLNAGLKLNNYKDDFREINNYQRLNLFANAREELSENLSLSLRYQLLNNRFNNRVENNYTRHALSFGALMNTGVNQSLNIEANADLSNSSTSYFDYNRYKPQITYQSGNELGKSRNITAYAEVFQFNLVPLRSNNKYFFGMRGSKPGNNAGTSNTSEFAFLYRQFPNNARTDFYQINLGKGFRAYGSGNKQLNTQLVARYFPNNQDFSHADLHMNYQSNSKTYYSFTGNIRYWYPGATNFITTDIYAKVGVKVQSFSISPLLGLHNNLDLKADEISLKNDKNSLRAGLEVRGELLIAQILRWKMRGAYEYGFVNNAAVESINNVGEIVFGEIYQRNPTSLQLQTDLSAKVMRQTEVFGTLRYFTYNTDLTSQFTRTPVLGNDRFTAQLGLRFGYN
ncbi:hypothetical protein [Jiulongibacter sediminis]|uniref:Outer membrane protein beta-barrel domain-containing protein n=1 Tax=Jiulongibacter sediminis TaxID=1605367 RepID=A0A0P7BUA4_9BACT|nr:hypothetical protein [Jiulongibacter sediminis]KPM48301.1 hypothetical protein AFM12_06505 [Jiulongibacter sediminis]TBX24840.1 hypothetical protein TK44_06510 [Jiulongibacter sediminis]